MKAVMIGLIGFVVCVISVIAICAITVISYNNNNTMLFNDFDRQTKSNQAEFDSMWKTIKQTSQVDEKYRDDLKEIVMGNATARTGDGKKGNLATWVQESMPTVDPSTANRLMGIIEGGRDRFARSQSVLAAIAKQQNDLVETFPGSFIIFNKEKLDAKLVTSAYTEQAFSTGKEESIKLYEEN